MSGLRLVLAAAAAFSLVFALAAPASSCDTPVYRYAMYRWNPAPYELYFFHEQPPGPTDRLVAERLSAAARALDAANIVHIPVDLGRDPELAGVPADVKQAWEERDDKSVPWYLLASPYGRHVHKGEMEPATLPAVLQSPARKQLGRQLEAGKVGVFVVVPGNDAAENERVDKLLSELKQQLAEGAISMRPEEPAAPGGDAAPGGNAAPGGDAAAADRPANPEIAIVRVARDDAEEAWFVRTLLAMESELADEQRPLVFLVYGRGRALLPYIGAGITRDNLVRELQFISGACSCTVKEQNPGVDLLLQYDWEAAAAALAERFGVEEGNESQFGPGAFFPELVIPSAGPLEGSPLSQAATEGDPPTDATPAPTTSEAAAAGTTPPDAASDTASDAASDQVVIHGKFNQETAGAAAMPNTAEPNTAEPNTGEPNTGEPTTPDDSDDEVGDELAVSTDGAGGGGLGEDAADSAADSGETSAAGAAQAAEQAAKEVANGTATSPPGQEVAIAAGSTSTEARESLASSSLSIFVVGGGLAVAFVVLVGVTFLVMRPR